MHSQTFPNIPEHTHTPMYSQIYPNTHKHKKKSTQFPNETFSTDKSTIQRLPYKTNRIKQSFHYYRPETSLPLTVLLMLMLPMLLLLFWYFPFSLPFRIVAFDTIYIHFNIINYNKTIQIWSMFNKMLFFALFFALFSALFALFFALFAICIRLLPNY